MTHKMLDKYKVELIYEISCAQRMCIGEDKINYDQVLKYLWSARDLIEKIRAIELAIELQGVINDTQLS